jgi:hypothetical protein
LLPPTKKGHIAAAYQRGGMLLDQTCSCFIDFMFVGGLKQHELQPEQMRSLLRLMSL